MITAGQRRTALPPSRAKRKKLAAALGALVTPPDSNGRGRTKGHRAFDAAQAGAHGSCDPAARCRLRSWRGAPLRHPRNDRLRHRARCPPAGPHPGSPTLGSLCYHSSPGSRESWCRPRSTGRGCRPTPLRPPMGWIPTLQLGRIEGWPERRDARLAAPPPPVSGRARARKAKRWAPRATHEPAGDLCLFEPGPAAPARSPSCDTPTRKPPVSSLLKQERPGPAQTRPGAEPLQPGREPSKRCDRRQPLPIHSASAARSAGFGQRQLGQQQGDGLATCRPTWPCSPSNNHSAELRRPRAILRAGRLPVSRRLRRLPSNRRRPAPSAWIHCAENSLSASTRALVAGAAVRALIEGARTPAWAACSSERAHTAPDKFRRCEQHGDQRSRLPTRLTDQVGTWKRGQMDRNHDGMTR